MAGSAFAQSNVTIYGVVDAGVAHMTATGLKSQNAVESGMLGGSRIGFKGVEDLGNGLKAIFQYESGFSADNAGNLAGGRDTFVGLTGGFGTVVAGNLTHPLRAMGAKVELMPGASGVGTTMSVTGRIGGLNTGADDRASNAIAYVSPSFGGFSGTVAYVNGETQPNGNGAAEARQYQIAGQYDNGPLFVGAGYHRADNIGGNADVDGRIYPVAAVYSLPTNTKLTALYDNTKIDVNGEYVKRTAWSIGAAQSFGKNTVGLEYARSGKIKTNEEGADTANTGANILSALYTYEISKRTSVHARYSRLANDDASKANFYLNPVANPITAANGVNLTGYMVGLRHSF
jgi:predicted porin